MDEIDLNTLVLFMVIVDSGSLTGAARETKQSLATVSRKLAALEHMLGAALLERNARRLSPTPFGRTVLVHARRIADEGRAVNDAALEVRTGVQGTLRLSVPTEFGQAWLGRVAAAFMVLHPDVVIEIQTNEGTVDFARDDCDVAIVLRDLPDSTLVRKQVMGLRRGLFAAPSYLERRGIPLGPDDLIDHHCLITNLQSSEGGWLLSQKRQCKTISPVWAANVANMGLLRELVVGGAGIGMLNDLLCQRDLQSGRLVKLLPDWSGPPVVATAIIPGHRLITRRSRAFLDFIYRFMVDAVPDGNLAQATSE